MPMSLVLIALSLLVGGLAYLLSADVIQWLTNATSTLLLVVGSILFVCSLMSGEWRCWKTK